MQGWVIFKRQHKRIRWGFWRIERHRKCSPAGAERKLTDEPGGQAINFSKLSTAGIQQI